jgi:AraC family transcriptional regulator
MATLSAEPPANPMLRYFANGRVRWKNGMRCNTRTNWEFYAVLDGRCAALLSDGADRVLHERTLWVFAPDCAHAWADDGRSRYHRLSFHFGNVPYPLDEVVRSRGGWLARKLSDADVAELARIADSVAPHYCNPTQVACVHFQRALADLALIALRDEKFESAPPALADIAHFKVEHAVSWYRDHLAKHPPVKAVADAIHVSTSHLRRLFRQVRRTSPKAAFKTLRLERAKDLMSRTSLTLDEIARDCGYANASHLCREHKALYSFTANTWRRRLVDRFTEPLPAGTVPVREYSARPAERTMPA